MNSKLEELLNKANSQLKQGNIGITIFKRGNKLSLRGMMPPKPGSKSNKLSQQTISLGIYANAAGIKTAKIEAQKLGSAIALNEFSWNDYQVNNKSVGSVDYWLKKFEEDYFSKRDRNSKSETTWRDYQKIFSKFPADALLNNETLLEVVLSTLPDTRTRQKACTYTSALAKFASIDFDPTSFKGNYSAESLELRDLPTPPENSVKAF